MDKKESFETFNTDEFNSKFNTKKKNNKDFNKIIRLNSKNFQYCHLIIFILLFVFILIIFRLIILKSSSLSVINSKILEIDAKIESVNKMIRDSELSAKFENDQYYELSVSFSSFDKKMIELKDRIKKLKIQEDSLKREADKSLTLDRQINNYSKEIKIAEKQIKDINSFNFNHFEEKQVDYTQSVLKESSILFKEEYIQRLERLTNLKVKKVCYSSKNQQYSGKVYSDNCKYFPNVVFLIYIRPDQRIGGFLPYKSHNREGESITSKEVYLFNLGRMEKYFPKFGVVSVKFTEGGFPQFGNGDLFLDNKEQIAKSNFPKSFICTNCKSNENLLTQGVNSFFFSEIEGIVMQ